MFSGGIETDQWHEMGRGVGKSSIQECKYT